MSVSDADFLAWLNDERSVKCALVEASYRDDDILGFEYLATHPFVSAPTDPLPNQIYNGWIKSIPQFEQTMSEVFMGHTTANLGEIVVAAGTPETDTWVMQRDWIGRALYVYVGDPSWPQADFRRVWSGVTADLRVRGTSEIVFVARDMQHLLNQPIVVPKIESGPLYSQPMPAIFGTVYNVPCVLIDETTRKYRFNDGPVASVSEVRVGGAVYGSATVDLFGGTLTLATDQKLPVTADVVGATFGSSPLDNASDLIKHLVTVRGYFTDADLDIDSFNTLKAQCAQKIGYGFGPADVMVYEAVDEICNTVGAYTAMTREGKYYVRRFDLDGESRLDIGQNDIMERGLELERVLAPVAEIRIGAKKNNAPNLATSADTFSGATPTMVARSRVKHWSVGVSEAQTASTPKTRRLPAASAPVEINPGEEDGTIPSLFVNAADAQAEADRRMGLWGVRRFIFKVTCYVAPLTLKLGDAVTITHPRYGFAAGRKATVIRLRERLSQKQTELGVIL